MCALRFELKHSDDTNSNSKLFQVLAVATGKDQLTIIQSCVDGTASAEVKDESSR